MFGFSPDRSEFVSARPFRNQVRNHFHLALRPFGDDDLSDWMQWLMTAHVRRYHRHYHSSGHVWQGRYKAFDVQDDVHYLKVLRKTASDIKLHDFFRKVICILVSYIAYYRDDHAYSSFFSALGRETDFIYDG